MRAEHINMTIPPDLREAVDHQARWEHTRRRTLIQKAVRVYLGLSRKQALRALLEQGYTELASEARQLEREFARLDAESLKDVDEARGPVLGRSQSGTLLP
jgi:metal-responsive CopG/Arc/MetJ family transcriptional regulator